VEQIKINPFFRADQRENFSFNLMQALKTWEQNFHRYSVQNVYQLIILPIKLTTIKADETVPFLSYKSLETQTLTEV
jgi:hypothetical protein